MAYQINMMPTAVKQHDFAVINLHVVKARLSRLASQTNFPFHVGTGKIEPGDSVSADLCQHPR